MIQPLRALLLLAILACSGTLLAQGFTLSGTVFGGGSPLNGTAVEALQDGTSTVVASMTTGSSGGYSLTLTNATYDLRVTPPAGSGFGIETIQDIVINGADRTYDVILLASGNSGGLSGTIRGRGGNPLPNVNVTLYTSNWNYLGNATTDANGRYNVPASGTVHVQIYGPPSAHSPSFSAARYSLPISGATTFNIDLEVAQLTGIVKDSSGGEIAGASLSGSTNSYVTATGLYVNSYASATSAANGSYAMQLLKGSGQFTIYPPSGSAFAPLSAGVAITGDMTQDFVLSAVTPLTGTILGRNAQPLANVNVTVYTSNWNYLGSTTTDANGRYSVNASGTVHLQLYGPSSANSPSWSGARYNLPVSGATNFDISLNVAEVSGVVQGSDGAVVAGASLNASTNSYDGASALYLNSYASAVTSATGAYSMKLLTGSAQFTVYPPSGTPYSPHSQGASITGDSTVNFTLPTVSPLSGTIRGAGGNPLPNVNVNVYTANWNYLGSSTTDANGYYSVPASGTVHLQIYAPASQHSPSWSGARYNLPVPGPTTFNITVPVVSVTGITTDSNGAGVPGVTINASVNSYDSTQQLYLNSYAGITSAADGRYSFLLIPGSAQFSIYPPARSGFLPTSLSGVQLTGNITQRIVLQHPDLVAPLIVAGPVVVHLSATSVSVSWTTNEPATSRVDYGLGGLGSTVNRNALTTRHEVTLLNLARSATYTFRVGSADASGNGPVYSAIGTFSTQAEADATAPRITDGPRVLSIDQTSAIIQWETDEPASSGLSYGNSSALGTNVSGEPGRFTVSHSIRLTGLTAQTTYFVEVTSADPDANRVTSSVFSFATLAVPDTVAPVISGLTIASTTDTKVTVVWTTNEPATSGISYNDGTHFGVISDASLTTDHEITLSGLTPSTTYFITVSSKDAAGNGPTLAGPINGTTQATPDTTAPVISNVTVIDITPSTATVQWTTNEPSDSGIRYGTVSGSLDNIRADVSNVTAHELTLTGLAEGTRYSFVVRSTDSSSNSSSSSELDFTTGTTRVDQPPSAPGPITAPSLTNAISFDITWGASTDDVALASYDVLIDGSVWATLPASVTTATITALGEGAHSVQIRATDSAGKTAVSEQVATEIDRTAPVINTAAVTIEATGPTTPVSYAATASDTRDGSVTPACSPASGSSFAVGDTTVTCSATDLAGNTATSSFVVTVKDTSAPLLNVPSSISSEATGASGAAVTFAASASDLVDGSVTATCTPASGSTFALGITSVTCTATDAAGNTASRSFDVQVVDTTAPVVSVPADITAEATSASGAAVTFAAAGRDTVSGALGAVCTPASGSTFRLGVTPVSCSSTDAAGNIGTASFRVIVRDTTAPVLTAPDLTREATSAAGAAVAYTVGVTDAVTSNIVAQCAPASGSTFAIGTTTVSCSATDGAGNTASITFKVIVRDTTAPVISSVTPSLAVLWPPNHQMVPMSVAVAATDVVDPAPACRVTTIASNEVIDGLGDGDTSPDWLLGTGLNFQLRAERAGKGTGRTYTITVNCTDTAGNNTSATTTVWVPKHQ